MFKLKITSITAQRDMKSLVRYLLGLPGLDPDRVSRGLKILPFEILSVEQEAEARKIQATIEKFGALCVVEDTNAFSAKKSAIKKNPISSAENRKSHKLFYLIVGIIIVVTISFGLSFDYSDNKEKYSPQPQQKQQNVKPAIQQPDASNSANTANTSKSASAEKSSEDLKKDLNRNPYNPDAWKALLEKHEQAGDTADARKAKEAYEKAIRTQKVLSSLAKTFGNNVRVEITEDAVYYRISQNFKTEDEFYYEVSKLRDSLSVKFKGRRLIVENYGNGEIVQRLEMDP